MGVKWQRMGERERERKKKERVRTIGGKEIKKKSTIHPPFLVARKKGKKGHSTNGRACSRAISSGLVVRRARALLPTRAVNRAVASFSNCLRNEHRWRMCVGISPHDLPCIGT